MVRLGQGRLAWDRFAFVRSGYVRLGQDWLGLFRLGQGRFGLVRLDFVFSTKYILRKRNIYGRIVRGRILLLDNVSSQLTFDC